MKTSVDIVIMGTGVAGLGAALAALDTGASVMVFEKRPFQGGSVSNCPIVYGYIPDDPDYQNAVFKLLYEYTHDNANPGGNRA